MTKSKAGILVIVALLIGLHSRTAAQSSTKPQIIAQSGANPHPLDPNTLNVSKANVAARSSSTAENSPKGMWTEFWNVPHQTFAWKAQVPKTDKYSVHVLASGAFGGQIEVASPRGTIKITIPAGNLHWGNNRNRISVPGWLNLPKEISNDTVRSPIPAGIATNRNRLKNMALMSLELSAGSQKQAIEKRIRDSRSSAKQPGDAQYSLKLQWGEWGLPNTGNAIRGLG